MAAKVKKRDHEKLDSANIEKVIKLLEQEKPISKKEACELLNITYNTTRLAKIISEHMYQKDVDRKRRAENRGKAATDFEMSTIAAEYLAGTSIKEISEQLYRSPDFVKRIIEQLGVPQAQSGESYFKFSPLPEQCIAESFEVGEYVWASRYGALAEVIKEYPYLSSDGLSKVYQIFVFERLDEEKMLIDGQRYNFHPPAGTKFVGRYANQCAYDLGSLKHLTKYGVNLEKAIK